VNRDPKRDPRKSEADARWVDAYRAETRRVELSPGKTQRVEPRQVVPAEPHYWLNRLAPDFTLPIVDGGRLSLSDLRGYIVILNFWSAECAWSRRADVLLVYRALTWESKGVRIVGIASNYNELESQIRYETQSRHLRYPVLMDFDHRVADLYRAEKTPHFFVLDRQGLARYIGALDDATQEERDARVLFLDKSVNALLNNRDPELPCTIPYGCELPRPAGRAGSFPR
jgi:peroxiredoxin